jgi:hypothetical protein
MDTGVDPRLVERVQRGEYVVDPHAVAAAMIRRWRGGPSPVLVAVEPLDDPAVRADEDEPAARDGLA